MGKKCLFYDKKWNVEWREYFMFYKTTIKSTKTHKIKVTIRDENCLYIMDNARIHKTDKIVKLIKDWRLVVFTISPYSSELNKIEHTFGRLKNRISFQNLNSKDLKHIIIEEIKKLKIKNNTLIKLRVKHAIFSLKWKF